jgi:hypothetical protein
LISEVLYGRGLLTSAADSGICFFSGNIGCSSPKLRKSQRYAATRLCEQNIIHAQGVFGKNAVSQNGPFFVQDQPKL